MEAVVVLIFSLYGKRDGSAVGTSDLGPKGLQLESGPVRVRCVLRQNT